jgi:hypothetical protein
MKKTFEAWGEGYILFYVNDVRFFRYNTAIRHALTLNEVWFRGLNIWEGWREFYLKRDRCATDPHEAVQRGVLSCMEVLSS